MWVIVREVNFYFLNYRSRRRLLAAIINVNRAATNAANVAHNRSLNSRRSGWVLKLYTRSNNFWSANRCAKLFIILANTQFWHEHESTVRYLATRFERICSVCGIDLWERCNWIDGHWCINAHRLFRSLIVGREWVLLNSWPARVQLKILPFLFSIFNLYTMTEILVQYFWMTRW